MLKVRVLSAALACLAIAAVTAGVHASGHGRTLVVTMTNDQNANEIKVYDAESQALLQTLSTHGKGGAGGNARGIKQYGGGLVAAVNNGSGTVALFRRDGDALKFDKVIQTTSARERGFRQRSHVCRGSDDRRFIRASRELGRMARRHDRALAWPAVGVPAAADGASWCHRAATARHVEDRPGSRHRRRHRASSRAGLPVPRHGGVGSRGTLTPLVSAVYPDGTAVITLAHSDQDGLFRDGAFTSVVGGRPGGLLLDDAGREVRFTANTGSRTISRLIGTGNHVFVDAGRRARSRPDSRPGHRRIGSGDARRHRITVPVSRTFHLWLQRVWRLAARGGTVSTVGVANANGVAILAPGDRAELKRRSTRGSGTAMCGRSR